MQLEKPARIKTRKDTKPKRAGSDRQQKHYLPIQTWSAKISSHPTVNTEVDHRRERPDILSIRKTPKGPCCDSHQQIDRKCQILVMQHGGQRKCCSPRHRG